jgi:DNA repair photolyase
MEVKVRTIYEPKGKAREYCELALNLFTGCPHGCEYCYAPTMLRMPRDVFHAKAEPRLGILATLERDAAKFSGREVFLCFSCDPYPPDDLQMMARQAIKILHAVGARVRILTKGGKRADRDFDLLGQGDFFGVTLTALFDTPLEPGAARQMERCMSLHHAHELGISTWVSLEPVLDPAQSLLIIKATYSYVDVYKLGMWNYDERAKTIDWKKYLSEAVELLDSLGKTYYIKKDLYREAYGT